MLSIRPLAISLAAVVFVTGCVPRAALKERSSRDEVRAAWGAPISVKPAAAGERWIFSNAPDGGRETWFVDFDESGRLSSYTQVLTEERAKRIRAGQTRAEVEDLIGPHYYTMRYPFKPDQIEYVYRYMTPPPLIPICFYVNYDNAGTVISTGTRNDRIGNPGLERPCM